MPHVLTFSDDRHFGYLTTAIDQLRINLVAGRSIAIDFYATYKVSPQAMLFLLAEVDRLVHLFGVPRFKTITPRSPKVQEVFKQTGLYATLGVESDIQPKREDVIHWVAMSGSRVKSEELADGINRAAGGTLPSKTLSSLMKGIGEATSNCLSHAYIESRNDGLGHHPTTQWWFLGQLRGNTLSVGVCDLGIGVPRSLSIENDGQILTKIIKSMRGLFSTKDHWDVKALCAAFEIGKTRTERTNRGKGLAQTLAALRELDDPLLIDSHVSFEILSNRASYSVLAAPGRINRPKIKTLRKSIRGTMLTWSFVIPSHSANHE